MSTIKWSRIVGTIAFYAVLEDAATIPYDTAVIFSDVLVNIGDG